MGLAHGGVTEGLQTISISISKGDGVEIDLNKEWNYIDVELEYEHHGSKNLVETHNKLRAELADANETLLGTLQNNKDYRAKIDRLQELLREARQDIADWAAYADDYFQKKHDLAGTLAKYDAALGGGRNDE